ncbi:MAG: hypothetical protein J0G32_05400 [Alphaproteobacteria bacterium]|nr:hypothetical protein [Alphaproteobacteria bacterium]OJV14039.1 MAG: hypothetical protein BGO27_00920 [Alphaproteobacteria bacterium 33-17]
MQNEFNNSLSIYNIATLIAKETNRNDFINHIAEELLGRFLNSEFEFDRLEMKSSSDCYLNLIENGENFFNPIIHGVLVNNYIEDIIIYINNCLNDNKFIQSYFPQALISQFDKVINFKYFVKIQFEYFQQSKILIESISSITLESEIKKFLSELTKIIYISRSTFFSWIRLERHMKKSIHKYSHNIIFPNEISFWGNPYTYFPNNSFNKTIKYTEKEYTLKEAMSYFGEEHLLTEFHNFINTNEDNENLIDNIKTQFQIIVKYTKYGKISIKAFINQSRNPVILNKIQLEGIINSGSISVQNSSASLARSIYSNIKIIINPTKSKSQGRPKNKYIKIWKIFITEILKGNISDSENYSIEEYLNIAIESFNKLKNKESLKLISPKGKIHKSIIRDDLYNLLVRDYPSLKCGKTSLDTYIINPFCKKIPKINFHSNM